MASSKVSDVYNLARTCLADDGAQWATNAYLRPKLQLANLDVNGDLSSCSLSYQEKVLTLPAVAAGSSDLSAFTVAGQPLEDMEEPITLEWRRVGTTDLDWTPIPRKDKVLDTDGSKEGIASWEWRESIIYVTKSAIAVDLRLRFDSITLDLADPTSEIIRGILNVLAYKTAHIVAAVRGGMAGTGEPLAKWCERMYDNALEDFELLVVKHMQGTRRRFGRANRAAGRGMNTPVPIP